VPSFWLCPLSEKPAHFGASIVSVGIVRNAL